VRVTDLTGAQFILGTLAGKNHFEMKQAERMPPTICIVTQQLRNPVSGIGIHAKLLINRLVKDHYRVLVITPAGEMIAGLPVTYYQVPAPFFSSNQARWFFLALSNKKILSRVIRLNKVDLIHFTDARESLFYTGQIPAVGNINDTYSALVHPLSYYARHYRDWLARWIYYRIVHSFEKIALNRLEVVIANSQYTAGVVREQYKLAAEHVRVCYKSIDPAPFQSIKTRRRNLPAHPPRILFVGGNMQRKGLPTLIRAAADILKEEPSVSFWVVGGDHNQPAMEKLCSVNHVRDHFQFLGWRSQSELQEIYPQCDIFAMPSLVEALGVVFLEAMAAGLVPVATKVGGIPEIIQDGCNGRLVSPDAPDELARTIIELLQDPKKMEALQKNGVGTLKKFSVGAMMEITYKIYHAAMGDFKHPSI
jgi:glycosyltransferase involved in cell wall biosynthesis